MSDTCVTFLADHIQRKANKGKWHVSYLFSTVCEEFIEILGERLEEVIVDELKAAEYYSVSVGSTPDVSHTDQLAVIFRQQV